MTGISYVTDYLPGEVLDVKNYYSYLKPEIEKLPEDERSVITDLAPAIVHRLKDPSALEIMGLMAGQRALDASGTDSTMIDGLMTAQSGGKQFMPLIASYLQLNLGLRTGIIARNVNDGDISFLSAVNLARQYIKSGLCKNVLVIGSSALIGGKYGFGADLTEPWCMHLGDGAAACIVSEEDAADYEIVGFHFETEANSSRLTGTLNGDYGPIREPNNRDLCFAAEMDDKAGAYVISHDEKFIKTAGRKGFITEILTAASEKAGLTLTDLDHIIPVHNAELIDIWERELEEAGVKDGTVCHLQRTAGHAGGEDTFIDLARFGKEGRFKKGDVIALVVSCPGVQSAVLIIRKN